MKNDHTFGPLHKLHPSTSQVAMSDRAQDTAAHSRCDCAPISDKDCFASFACGWSHALAVTDSGAVVTWGRGTHGQQGPEYPKHDVFSPHRICICRPEQSSLTRSADMHAAAKHTAAVDALSSAPKADADAKDVDVAPVSASTVYCGSEHCMVLRNGETLVALRVPLEFKH